DVAALRWGYKKGRELLRRLPAFRGAFVPAHPQFPADSAAGAALAETCPSFSTTPPNSCIQPKTTRLSMSTWGSSSRQRGIERFDRGLSDA
ncbi:hypothetical protein B0H14DRAFT_2356796, partial [Mycena olivaceomarginata]